MSEILSGFYCGACVHWLPEIEKGRAKMKRCPEGDIFCGNCQKEECSHDPKIRWQW